MAKVLIVEDESDLLEIYKEVIEGAGFEVMTAKNGRVAIERLGEKVFDLVLLDLMMPEMDGMEVLKHIRSDEHLKNIKVIILTNLSSDVIIKESFAAKVDGYLMKTELTPNQIVEEVRGFLN